METATETGKQEPQQETRQAEQKPAIAPGV